jgi:hypothetical protein
MKHKPAKGCSKYCLGIVYNGFVSETKHFKNTMKFIDTANKPVVKVAKKTTTKLNTFKKDIIQKTNKEITTHTSHVTHQHQKNRHKSA